MYILDVTIQSCPRGGLQAEMMRCGTCNCPHAILQANIIPCQTL